MPAKMPRTPDAHQVTVCVGLSAMVWIGFQVTEMPLTVRMEWTKFVHPHKRQIYLSLLLLLLHPPSASTFPYRFRTGFEPVPKNTQNSSIDPEEFPNCLAFLVSENDRNCG